jgi:hypothetical protein
MRRTATIVGVDALLVMALVLAALLVAGASMFVIYRLLKGRA